MPFEISPKFVEAPARVGTYRDLADMMLLGCRETYPIKGRLIDGLGGACALGALYVGAGSMTPTGNHLSLSELKNDEAMRVAYMTRYGERVQTDNDSGAFTREQIAARIAAL